MRSPRRQATEARQFRALAARENFLLTDRLDIQFAVERAVPFHVEANKDIGLVSNVRRDTYWRSHARFGSSVVSFPKSLTCSLIPIGRAARCLASRPVAVWWQLEGVYCRAGSVPRKFVATSSGEAEYYALTKAAEGFVVQAVAVDMGWYFKLQHIGDSTTARAVANRTGLGKLPHLEVRFLWVQEALRDGRFELSMVAGSQNPADLATKGLARLRFPGLSRWWVGDWWHARPTDDGLT